MLVVNRIIIVVLAKHEIAPRLWFLREPKHVGAIVGIIIVFKIPMILKLCASVGIINSVFDTIDARCKHEDCSGYVSTVVDYTLDKSQLAAITESYTPAVQHFDTMLSRKFWQQSSCDGVPHPKNRDQEKKLSFVTIKKMEHCKYTRKRNLLSVADLLA